MNIFSKELFAKDANGTIRFWSINCDHSKDLNKSRIIISHGVFGGEKSLAYENITEGLGTNSVQEQAISRCESRVNKKLDSGYVESFDCAQNNEKRNILGFKKPMLAKKFQDRKNKINYESGFYVQRKYNGHRCLITKYEDEIISYSRNGKLIKSINHINNELKQIMDNGETIDGELYCHGEHLQTISSWVRRKQLNTLNLQYVVYDIVSDKNFSERISILRKYLNCSSCVALADTYFCYDENELYDLTDKFIKDGYEGSIIRLNKYSYEDGKRSNSLIKFKKFLDDEFKIIDVYASSDNHAILTCITKDKKRFSVNAPGDFLERKFILLNKEKYIGRKINIQYSELTKDKIPFHPVAKYFRDND